jgi:hypothetical protein
MPVRQYKAFDNLVKKLGECFNARVPLDENSRTELLKLATALSTPESDQEYDKLSRDLNDEESMYTMQTRYEIDTAITSLVETMSNWGRDTSANDESLKSQFDNLAPYILDLNKYFPDTRFDVEGILSEQLGKTRNLYDATMAQFDLPGLFWDPYFLDEAIISEQAYWKELKSSLKTLNQLKVQLSSNEQAELSKIYDATIDLSRSNYIMQCAEKALQSMKEGKSALEVSSMYNIDIEELVPESLEEYARVLKVRLNRVKAYTLLRGAMDYYDPTWAFDSDRYKMSTGYINPYEFIIEETGLGKDEVDKYAKRHIEARTAIETGKLELPYAVNVERIVSDKLMEYYARKK